MRKREESLQREEGNRVAALGGGGGRGLGVGRGTEKRGDKNGRGRESKGYPFLSILKYGGRHLLKGGVRWGGGDLEEGKNFRPRRKKNPLGWMKGFFQKAYARKGVEGKKKNLAKSSLEKAFRGAMRVFFHISEPAASGRRRRPAKRGKRNHHQILPRRENCR